MKTSQNRFDQFWLFSVDFENFIIPVYQICLQNHELFRYVIPKGHSFNHLNQKQFDLITSHVNSLKRKSTDFSTPIEKFYAFFGKDILDKLNINFIEPNDVILSRELIKN